jgi:hypothetical protein
LGIFPGCLTVKGGATSRKIALALAYAAMMAIILRETNFFIDIHPLGLIGFVVVFTAIVAARLIVE